MKEYYINEDNQKRRLKLYHGDYVICENEDCGNKEIFLNIYKIIHETDGTWCLYCSTCGRKHFSVGKDKNELKQHLIENYKVVQVISKHEMVDIIQQQIKSKYSIIKD